MRQWKKPWLGVRDPILVLAQPLTHYVTLGKSLSICIVNIQALLPRVEEDVSTTSAFREKKEEDL